MRAAVAVLVGFGIWTVLWLGGASAVGALFPEEMQAYTDGQGLHATAPLATILALSIVASLAAGASAASVARQRAFGASFALGVLLLLVGLGVQVSAWDAMPVWYHVAFLVLLLPVTLSGARLMPRTPVA